VLSLTQPVVISPGSQQLRLGRRVFSISDGTPAVQVGELLQLLN